MENLFNTTRSQTFLVLGDNQAVQTSPSVIGKIALDDFATDSVNLADKQLGVVVDAHTNTALEKHFLVAADTYPSVRTIRLVQGTPVSGAVSTAPGYRIGDQPYVQSNPINLNEELHVVSTAAKQSYSSAWVVGDLAANPGAITPVDNILYKFKIGFGGRLQKKQYANAGVNRMYVSIKKLTPTVTNPRDQFIKRLAASLNLLSSHEGRKRSSGRSAGNKPAIVFAINLAGGAGTSITTILAAAVNSTFIYETKGSVNYTFTVTEDFKETLRQTAANIGNVTNATTIEVINLATAGSVAMAAGAAAADALLVVALDSKPAYVDDRMEDHKTTIEQIGLEGFDINVRRVIGSRPYRGYGYGWQLYNEYLKRAQQEIIGGETFPLENRPMMPIPSYMATDETQYNVHEIWSQALQYAGNTRFDRRSQIVILQPVADAATSTSMNTSLRLLLQSCPNVTYHTEATPTDIFV